MTESGLSIWDILTPLLFLGPIGLATAWVALRKRRSVLLWLVLGTLTGVIALLLVAALPAAPPRDHA